MANFKRTLVAEDGIAKIRTEALGDNTGQYGTKDVGVLVKLSAGACVQCSTGDDIYGAVHAIEAGTINDGFSFGAVKQSHRIKAIVASDQTGSMAVGDLVVAGVQPALGTGTLGGAITGVAAVVGVTLATPDVHKWQCIAVESTGAVGEVVLLEKV